MGQECRLLLISSSLIFRTFHDTTNCSPVFEGLYATNNTKLKAKLKNMFAAVFNLNSEKDWVIMHCLVVSQILEKQG